MNAQYTAITGGGYDGSSQYGVAYTLGVQTDVYAYDGTAHTITGCYVTNNLWAYQSITEGDYSSTPFGGTSGNDPDWFKLTATGKNAAGQTVGTLDFYLADYRFANNEEDYVVDTWEWFDLSPLGPVHTISFSLSSTKSNAYGMLTPAYFCIDDFNGEAPTPPNVGIGESSLDVRIFPNPCQGQLHLSLVNAQEFEYSIINMMGQTITQGHSQGQEIMIDLSQCPMGVYLISVIQDGKRFVQKLVLN